MKNKENDLGEFAIPVEYLTAYNLGLKELKKVYYEGREGLDKRLNAEYANFGFLSVVYIIRRTKTLNKLGEVTDELQRRCKTIELLTKKRTVLDDDLQETFRAFEKFEKKMLTVFDPGSNDWIKKHQVSDKDAGKLLLLLKSMNKLNKKKKLPEIAKLLKSATRNIIASEKAMKNYSKRLDRYKNKFTEFDMHLAKYIN